MNDDGDDAFFIPLSKFKMCAVKDRCSLKLETGTLVFGVIASIINVLLVFSAIGVIAAFNYMVFTPGPGYIGGYMGGRRFSVPRYINISTATVLGINAGLGLVLLKAVMDFTFSVFLCIGVTKKRPSHLKAYFIYGIVMAVLVSLAVLFWAIAINRVAGLIGTLVIVLYGLILHMINLTHKKLSAGEVYGFEHKLLHEIVY